MTYKTVTSTLLAGLALLSTCFAPNSLASEAAPSQEAIQCQEIAALTPTDISGIDQVSGQLVKLSKKCWLNRECTGDTEKFNACMKQLSINTFLLDLAYQTGKNAPIPYQLPNTQAIVPKVALQSTPNYNDEQTNTTQATTQNDWTGQNNTATQTKSSNQQTINWF